MGNILPVEILGVNMVTSPGFTFVADIDRLVMAAAKIKVIHNVIISAL